MLCGIFLFVQILFGTIVVSLLDILYSTARKTWVSAGILKDCLY